MVAQAKRESQAKLGWVTLRNKTNKNLTIVNIHKSRGNNFMNSSAIVPIEDH